MRKYFKLVVMFIVLVVGNNLAYSDPAPSGFNSINLSALDWYVKEGFQEQDRIGFDRTDDFYTKKVRPPIVMNEIFKVPTGSGVRHFAARIDFPLDKSKLVEPLVLQLGWIGENWEVFLNGKSQRKEIFLGKSGNIKKYRTFRGVVIRLNYADLQDGNNTLVFHIVGDGPVTSLAVNDTVGFLYSDPYLITTVDQLVGQQAEILFIALYTVYFFFGLYHVLIYSRRSKDLYNLFFGLFSIFLAIYGISQTMFVYDFVENTATITRMKYFPQPMLPILFILFFHYYFYPEKKISITLGLFTGISLALSLFFAFAPHRYLESALKAEYFLFIPVISYGVIVFVKTILLRKQDVGIMFLGVTLMIVATVFEVLDSTYFNTGIRVVKYSFFLFVMSLVAILANRFLTVHNESERLNVELTRQKNAFFRFVPTQFLELLGKHSAIDITLGDNSLQTMSVLMCDLRAFTNMSEKMTPEETFRFLNSYLARMEPIIQHYDGFVDKFIGDAILALFADSSNPKGSDSNSAERSLEAAIHMRRELVIYNEARKKENYQPIEFGIGINTGPLVLGTVGSSHRIDTTVIGNTVNLAARLESLTTFYRANIVISDHVYQSLSNPEVFRIREVDAVFVKGKSELSLIYEVYDADDIETKEKKDRTRDMISRGIVLYKNRDFHGAREVFYSAAAIFPEDRVIQLYLERCDQFIAEPPPADWNGVFELTHK